MKVRELIAALEKLPPDADVVTEQMNSWEMSELYDVPAPRMLADYLASDDGKYSKHLFKGRVRARTVVLN